MVTDSGVLLMADCDVRLEDEEPRVLLKDTGFEDQCAKLNNHPAKYIKMLMRTIMMMP